MQEHIIPVCRFNHDYPTNQEQLKQRNINVIKGSAFLGQKMFSALIKSGRKNGKIWFS